ncbi:MAG TPA: GAF domain-containing sensor histidine kinase, partial [Aggregatilineales bacterium]|nr:GAF domain-containing sensor histidine kinase [Aggregatilineales bacterium]
VVAYEYVSIILVEADKAEVVGTQNIAQNYQGVRGSKGKIFPIKDNRYLQQMFQTCESIIIPELEQAPAWIAESEATALGALLGAPIVVEDEVIGFLCVFNTNKEFFTPLHAQQLITFANQAGLAINNARLYEQAQSAAILRERQRMAQELHDSVNQDLFAASTYADLLPRAITRKPQVVAKYATDISRLIRRAVDQMRMILIELHPDTLTTTGLEVLIQQLCNVFRRQTGLPLELSTSNSNTILEEKIQITIYRITQEALHNIDRHAKAACVKVSLHITAAELALTIEDDGCGFDQNAITDVQFGVSGMQERAHSIGADLLIESEPGYGTKIKLRKKIS